MIYLLLHPAVQQFIRDHEHDDITQLLLKLKAIEGVPIGLIADQINGRRKSEEKLPTFYKNPSVVYPPVLNLEQCSSEKTGLYKLELLREEFLGKELNSIADLTGGFGVDAYSFSKFAKSVNYIEPNQLLLNIARHNHAQLSATNIQHLNITAEQYLQHHSDELDAVFIDPSRRLSGNKKVFKFSDCQPNVVALQQTIFKRTKHLLIKASPIIDLQQGQRELNNVKRIVVVAVNSECKEVLFFCEKDFGDEPKITAINLIADGAESFSFLYQEERDAEVLFTNPAQYLYEPNGAILKTGAFKMIALRNNLTKIHPNTHLYTSDTVTVDFPGRIFKLEAAVKSDPKEITQFFPDRKANVITRNYPLPVVDLKKKLQLVDGGSRYLIAFTGIREKYLYVASRIR